MTNRKTVRISIKNWHRINSLHKSHGIRMYHIVNQALSYWFSKQDNQKTMQPEKVKEKK